MESNLKMSWFLLKYLTFMIYWTAKNEAPKYAKFIVFKFDLNCSLTW